MASNSAYQDFKEALENLKQALEPFLDDQTKSKHLTKLEILNLACVYIRKIKFMNELKLS